MDLLVCLQEGPWFFLLLIIVVLEQLNNMPRHVVLNDLSQDLNPVRIGRFLVDINIDLAYFSAVGAAARPR